MCGSHRPLEVSVYRHQSQDSNCKTVLLGCNLTTMTICSSMELARDLERAVSFMNKKNVNVGDTPYISPQELAEDM